MKTTRPVLRLLPVLGLTALGSGCGALLGLDQFTEGSASTSTSSTSASTGGMGGMGTSSASTGGMGTGGSPACQPSETLPCDTGLKGACAPGTKTCLPDQTGFDTCKQNAQPTAADDCVNNADTTCDGAITCACSPGSTTTCTTGLMAACTPGTATCKADGTAYDACIPDVMPTVNDDCATLTDTNCNGTIDCACQAGNTIACMSGLPGACAAGTQMCKADGTGYAACVASVMPNAMPEDCKKLGDENCDGIACSETVFAKGFPTTFGVNNQGVASVGTDMAGNVYAFGDFVGSINLGGATLLSAGGIDVFLAKFDPSGQLLWSKRFGDAQPQQAIGSNALAVDAAGDVVIGGLTYAGSTINFGGQNLAATHQSPFVAKFDTNGNHIWSRVFDSTHDEYDFPKVAMDAQGNVLVSGAFTGTMLNFGNGILPNAGSYDVFLAKLASATGAGVWSKGFGDVGAQLTSGLAVDSSGSVYLCGEDDGTANFGGSAFGSGPFYVAKLDGFGAAVWNRRYNGGSDSNHNRMAVDGSGNIFIGGWHSTSIDFGGPTLTPPAGAIDVFVAKLNGSANGAHLWSKTFGTLDYHYFSGIAVSATGRVAIGGTLRGTIDFGSGTLTSADISPSSDGYVAVFENDGQPRWSRLFGGAKTQAVNAVAFDPLGFVALGGSNTGTMDFGSVVLTSVGQDAVVAKIAP